MNKTAPPNSASLIPDHKGNICICLTLDKNSQIGKELRTCTLTGASFLRCWAGQITVNTLSKCAKGNLWSTDNFGHLWWISYILLVKLAK